MTAEEVANELGITPQRVREFCRQGRLGQKVGRQWIITREEFEQFVSDDYPRQPGRPPERKGKE